MLQAAKPLLVALVFALSGCEAFGPHQKAALGHDAFPIVPSAASADEIN